jgi:hypothetical protein
MESENITTVVEETPIETPIEDSEKKTIIDLSYEK